MADLTIDLSKISKEAIFSDIDREFSYFISNIDKRYEVALAALLVSYTTMAGNVCLYLPSFAGKALKDVVVDTECNLLLPELEQWTKILRNSRAVGKPNDFVPMILDKSGRLYLQRYWYYEDMLARKIKDKIAIALEPSYKPYNDPFISFLLDTLFPSNFSSDLLPKESLSKNNIKTETLSCQSELDWQKAAAAASLINYFTVISGGPGTGKTTTIAKILIALCILEAKNGQKLSAAVTAPTGKAAARLMESINNAVEKVVPILETFSFALEKKSDLFIEELSPTLEKIANLPKTAVNNLMAKDLGGLNNLLKETIPTEAHTIHRLLGYKHGSTFFRHNKDNPLPYDLVIVDESSMADLPLMSKLFDALSPKSRIILLGDNNQLSSVESGAVLGDICSGPDGFTKEFADKIKSMGSGFESILSSSIPNTSLPLIANSIVMLKKSFRFDEKSGIGALSSLVNGGKSKQAIELLVDGQYRDVRFIDLSVEQNNINSLIEYIAVEEYRKSLKASNPQEAFDLLTQFRILTPIRKGQGGLEEINRYIDNKLAGRYGTLYNGLPVIVKRNDYGLNLYNGDIGIFLKEKDGGLKVFFQGQSGFRKFMPGRLPEHEIAYTLTVHKSQGSEFDRVLLVIPDSKSPVLTREMLYTGITRAKKEVVIMASKDSITRMVENPIKRYSGLTEALWGSANSLSTILFSDKVMLTKIINSPENNSKT
ncbi:MAG: exodeoxyribonuclease V subunit alpha [Desulfamplus sp.]|nr:exodeoxyribonuclease V subunit alpha [Desulfamplus sp.]